MEPNEHKWHVEEEPTDDFCFAVVDAEGDAVTRFRHRYQAEWCAAAPEMLAALNAAAYALAGALCQDLDHDDADETLRIVRAAIAKAKGTP